uniref:Uncharacterized protein n=1 Tax=Anguilla anguilla TaxID=7936 RepID=A0A0E9XNF7_ANGAN
MLNFDQTVKLMKQIASATGVQERIDGGEFNMMDYLFDVLLLEVIIRILEKCEGLAAIRQNVLLPVELNSQIKAEDM